ncbi:MAG: hypothetical protein IPI73_18875 [Betaproteobacteria bacterium]|nr:hypothetical protein [Betaproteobacteria bacterium]
MQLLECPPAIGTPAQSYMEACNAGNNEYGQLGNGTTTDSVTPVEVIPSGSGVTAVAAGADYTCAVVNGGVQCWGVNSQGQLGNGATTDSTIPVQANVTGSGSTTVAVGSEHTCAVVYGGVQCWGGNAFGQLGNGTITNSLIPVQAIPADSGVISVAVGSAHTCALASGGVKCWGSNFSGQLGDGDNHQQRSRPSHCRWSGDQRIGHWRLSLLCRRAWRRAVLGIQWSRPTRQWDDQQ